MCIVVYCFVLFCLQYSLRSGSERVCILRTYIECHRPDSDIEGIGGFDALIIERSAK